METTISNKGVYWGLYGDNEKENGNYYIKQGCILGLYGDNGEDNGNCYNGLCFKFWGFGP